MKQCPKCHLVYPPEDVFCPDDGSVLVHQFDAGQNRVVVSLEEDQPEIFTQHVSVHQPTQAVPVPGWLYAVLGGLIAVILMGGAYIFLVVPRERESDNARMETQPSTGNVMVNNPATSSPTAVEPIRSTPANIPISNSLKPVNVAPPLNVPANVMRPVGPLERRFTRTYSGTVGNDGVDMDLVRNRSSLTGKVRPRGRYADIYVEGYVEKDGSFSMDEKSDVGVITGAYRGQFNSDGTISGVWSKPDGDKPRSFFLRLR